jgi:hypothetical protein
VKKLQELLDEIRSMIPNASPEVEDALNTIEQSEGEGDKFDMNQPPEASADQQVPEEGSPEEESMESPDEESKEDEEFDMNKPPKARGSYKMSL